MDNFQCNKCFKTFTVSNYRIQVKNNIEVFTDNKNNHIRCTCGSYDVLSLEKEGEYCTNFNKFDSLSSDQKKAVLKKRSKDHFNRNVDGIRDQKEHIDKNFTGKMSDLK